MVHRLLKSYSNHTICYMFSSRSFVMQMLPSKFLYSFLCLSLHYSCRHCCNNSHLERTQMVACNTLAPVSRPLSTPGDLSKYSNMVCNFHNGCIQFKSQPFSTLFFGVSFHILTSSPFTVNHPSCSMLFNLCR